MPEIALPITALYAGLFALVMVALAIVVVQNRARSKINYLDGGDQKLGNAIRVHGNFCEYVPFALILLAVLELNGAAIWGLHALALVLLVARLSHAHALYSGTMATRVIGATGTWIVIAIAAIWSIMQYAG